MPATVQSSNRSVFIALLVVIRGILIKKGWLSVIDLLAQAAASKWTYAGIRGAISGLSGDLMRASKQKWTQDRALSALVFDGFAIALEYAKSEAQSAPGISDARAML